jgi:D-alanyl-lipoteichoic acid acyltransferase DltB (MBOAT superfamily)
MITMLLGGLWHGAAWNFVLWGFYQGSILSLHRIWKEWRGRADSLIFSAWKLWQIPLFFAVTCYGWLLFRAHSLGQIVHFTKLLIFDFGTFDYGAGLPKAPAVLGIFLLFLLELVQFITDDQLYYRRLRIPFRGCLIAAMITIVLMGSSGEPTQFIYFQF